MSKYHEDSSCDTCAYKGVDETEEPCRSCCHCYTDKYVKQSCKECIHSGVCLLRTPEKPEEGFGCRFFLLNERFK